MRLPLTVTAVIALAVAFAFRPQVGGTWLFWVGLVAPYAALSGVAVHRMHRDGVLRDRFAFRWGDFTIGVLIGGFLILCAWLVRNFALPQGSPQVAWLFRLLLQIGNVQTTPALAFLIVLLGFMEELVWRGLVLDALAERFGTRKSAVVCAGLYALAHVATVDTLSDPAAGPNPLLVIAAFGCGLTWGLAASRLGRLPPVIISHIAFSYFVPAIVLPRF